MLVYTCVSVNVRVAVRVSLYMNATSIKCTANCR